RGTEPLRRRGKYFRWMHSAGRSSARHAAALGYSRSSVVTRWRSRGAASSGSVASLSAAQYAPLIRSWSSGRLGNLATIIPKTVHGTPPTVAFGPPTEVDVGWCVEAQS